MQEDWKGKNIDLRTMSERIALFFSEKAFSTTVSQREAKTAIIAVPKSFHGIDDRIEVEVWGKPEDFSVKFTSGTRSQALVRFGSFASLITGGYFVLRGLKSQEEIEKLEKKFWIYVDETVWYLSNQRSP
jgi:hypothetical protein